MTSGDGIPRWTWAVFALLAIVALAGCAHLPFGQEETQPADSVPQNADYVGHVDHDALRATDSGVRSATRESLAFQSNVSVYDGPDFLDSLAFANGTELNRSRVESMTYFGRTNGSYRARVIRADWQTGAVVTAVERRENVTLTEQSNANRTLYVAENGSVAVAVLPEGFAVGQPRAVRDAVAVTTGDADPLTGTVRDRFEAETGYVRFAFRFHPEKVPNVPLIQTESFKAIRVVSAGYDTNESADGSESQMGVAINLTVADQNAADRIRQLLNSGVALYKTHVASPELTTELDKVTLERSGRRVTITYESTPEGFRTMLDGLREGPA